MKNYVHETMGITLFIAKNILVIVEVCNLAVIDDVAF